MESVGEGPTTAPETDIMDDTMHPDPTHAPPLVPPPLVPANAVRPAVEPEPVPGTAWVTPSNVPSARRRGRSIGGSILAVSLLSAVLASGSTAVIVGVVDTGGGSGASGAATTASGAAAQPAAVTVSQPADITDVVAQATKSVVTITSDTVAQGQGRFSPFSVPGDGRRLGGHPELGRLHPDQSPCRRRQHVPHGRARGWHAVPRHRGQDLG